MNDERRKGYVHNRVLIESSRVLDTQFNDALVFLTGAQIELLRNVSQYLNRRGTYVTEYKDGYYIAPDDVDYDAILAIVADLEEELMGNPNTLWGYKERLNFTRVGLSTGEGYTDAVTDPVPSGEVHRLEHWQIAHWDTGGRAVTLQLIGDVTTITLYSAPSLSPGVYVYQPFNITLAEGDTLRLRVFNLADTKASNLTSWGYTMQVP